MQISLQALIQPIPHELMPVANVYKSDLWWKDQSIIHLVLLG